MSPEQRERITTKLKAAAKKHPHKRMPGRKVSYQDVYDSWMAWNTEVREEADDE